MKKNVKLSLVAAVAAAGMLVGCSSDGTTQTPSASGAVAVGGSYVYEIGEYGLKLKFDDNNTCVNNVAITSGGKTESISFTQTQFNISEANSTTCANNISSFTTYTVNTALSKTIENLDDNISDPAKVSTLAAEYPGVTEFKSYPGQAQTNVETTNAVDNNKTLPTTIQINVNTNKALIAYKQTVKLALANGKTLADFKDVNITEAAANPDQNLSATVLASLSAASGLSQTQIASIKTIVDKNTSVTIEQIATEDTSLQTFVDNAVVQKLTATSLSVAGKKATLSNQAFTMSLDNNLTLDTIGDIVFAGAKLVENAKVAKTHTVNFTSIIKTGDKELKVVVVGGKIMTTKDSTSVSVEIPSTASVVLTQKNIAGLNAIVTTGIELTGTLNQTLTNADFTFNLNTILNAITSAKKEDLKVALNAFLTQKTTYTVELNTDITSTEGLSIDFARVQGTITVSGDGSVIVPPVVPDTNTTTPTNSAPTAPTGLALNPTSAETGATVTVSWTAATDADNDAITYDVRVMDENNNTVGTPKSGIATTSTTITAPSTAGTYKIEVGAKDSKGLESATGVIGTFTVTSAQATLPDVTAMNRFILATSANNLMLEDTNKDGISGDDPTFAATKNLAYKSISGNVTTADIGSNQTGFAGIYSSALYITDANNAQAWRYASFTKGNTAGQSGEITGADLVLGFYNEAYKAGDKLTVIFDATNYAEYTITGNE